MPSALFALAGVVAAVGASLCVLAACARLRAGRRTGAAAAGVVVLGVAAVVAFGQWFGLAESVYVTLLTMTVVLSALPFLLAAFRRPESQ